MPRAVCIKLSWINSVLCISWRTWPKTHWDRGSPSRLWLKAWLMFYVSFWCISKRMFVCFYSFLTHEKENKTNNPVNLSWVYNTGFIFHLLESISSRLWTNCFLAQKNLYWCGQDLKFSNELPLLGMFWISSVQWITLVVEPNSTYLCWMAKEQQKLSQIWKYRWKRIKAQLSSTIMGCPNLNHMGKCFVNGFLPLLFIGNKPNQTLFFVLFLYALPFHLVLEEAGPVG